MAHATLLGKKAFVDAEIGVHKKRIIGGKSSPGCRMLASSFQTTRRCPRPSTDCLRVLVPLNVKSHLMGVVRGWSLVSRMKTASNFAGSLLLALRLIEWTAPGGSDQLSPAR